MTRHRCSWASTPLLIAYHDDEWGVPARDDRTLFEYLVLESAQAGLSWVTILQRREGYRRAFADFDPERVARFGPEEIAALLADGSIIRNRRKIEAAVQNARAFLAVREQFGSFAAYIWGFVDGEPRINHWRTPAEVPATSPESVAMSRDLRRRGFTFVGPTICYAYMQAVGMVNDHLVDCFRHAELRAAALGTPPGR
ncbi:DNA-3-methyladenine glycosylase I [Symbiobacterium thermophilum]|uniref:DNA-3-methyladenine glycosylase I n=2 Tax=Symbiobacterium thermophilum TaxID=2734 RepID=Q67L03_SYMTH|nr:DNA-3-methyladenine glycosylase I [Symbiobacterium thermophilum]MBY6275219.1 DNA-3-methyladenine glycosylase I [Symbiobacterium thermophilum]BAD41643.1 3-Methyladenine DNA glycosylase [Symbiobacterium thermophilum IAM 14863]